MTQRDNILQELSGLNSKLVDIPAVNVYSVPLGYFDGLATKVLARIKAINATNTVDEPVHLSPLLSKVSKQGPYKVPSGYFEDLAEKVIQSIHKSSDHQTANEEIAALSPLLSGLRKQNPYSVPQGYFETIDAKPGTAETKVVAIAHRKWFRYAAAAVVVGIMVLGGLMYFNSRNPIDPVEHPYAWVKKSVKKVDSKEIDAFVKLVDETSFDQKTVALNPVNTEEIKELLKDVSDKEIQDFLNEIPETESSDNDALMN